MESGPSHLRRASAGSTPLAIALVLGTALGTLALLGYLGVLPAILSVTAALLGIGVKDHFDRKRGLELALTEEKRAIYVTDQRDTEAADPLPCDHAA